MRLSTIVSLDSTRTVFCLADYHSGPQGQPVRIEPANLSAGGFYGVPEVQEAFRKLPEAGTLHSDRIWARTEPSRPYSTRFL